MLKPDAGQHTGRSGVSRKAGISAVMLLFYFGLLWLIPPAAILLSLLAGLGLGAVWRSKRLPLVIASIGLILSLVYHFSQSPETDTVPMMLLGVGAGWLPAIVGALVGQVAAGLIEESLDRQKMKER